MIRVILLTIGAVFTVLAVPALPAQSLAEKETTLQIQLTLQRLPYYGVFDSLAFSLDRGTVTMTGFAFRESLKSDVDEALRRVAGVDTVNNRIEVLPASPNDDRIRWATFYSIYTDDFLSRYSPGGASGALYELRAAAGFPGMQPLGPYPIHIIVKGGRTTLVGLVGNASDKLLAGVRAREVTGVFEVTNDLVVQ